MNILTDRRTLAVISVVSLAVAFFAWFFPINTEVKSLRVGIISNIEPINIVGGVSRDDIKIVYQDRVIQNLVYLKMRIENDGNVPFVSSDFVENLSVHLPSSDSIIDFSVTPASIFEATTTASNVLELKTELINPRDFVDVEIIAESYTSPRNLDEVYLTGRIVGVENLSLYEYDEAEVLSDEGRKVKARAKLNELGRGLLFFSLILIPFWLLMAGLDKLRKLHRDNENLPEKWVKVLRTSGQIFNWTLLLCLLASFLFVVYSTVKLVIEAL